MTREQVLEIISEYRHTAGRCAHLENVIEELRDRLNGVNDSMTDDSTADTVRALSASIKAAERELSDKKRSLMYVKAWFKGIGDEREKWLIEKQQIDGVCWRVIVPMFEKEFSESYTRDGLKKMRNRALTKIYKIAECEN